MRKQTIGLAGALMLCGISMLTGCGARGLEQAYSFQEREAQMTPAAGAGLAPFFASSLCVPESADGDIAPDDAVTAQAGALFDVTDSSVIYGKNIYDQMYPASITKVMTAIIAIEEGNLSDAVTANDDVVIREAGASMAGIKPGDTFTLEQLLYGLMIPSGERCSQCDCGSYRRKHGCVCGEDECESEGTRCDPHAFCQCKWSAQHRPLYNGI